MKPTDITNQRFGQLTAVKRLNTKNISGSYYWEFQCDCGNTCQKVAAVIKRVAVLAKNPQTPSCGCTAPAIASANAKKTHTTHGYASSGAKHKLYGVWCAMLSRCYNPKNKSYKDYGAKGAAVCDGWRTDPQAFIQWAISAGWYEGLAVDKDIKIPGNKTYSPDACSLVTQTVNNRFAHKRETSYGKHKHVLLSSTHVSEILDKYAKGSNTQYELGELYGVSRSAVQKIVNSAGIQRGNSCP